ncbi:cation diffusion facilitator family transporter [Bacteroides luti]|uniref:Cation diffusion facilitator family transporter n=1 Tax=Bacteroides luti TaxID=1297750 RepID=A0A1M5E9U5_9BACE|nr:cation diffusion facilitator family transporter [Bacteroides luti]SHF75831.1 cation diffusion facilitator family transporter [Bacteroides luti]
MIKNEKKRVALLSVLAAIFLTGFKMIIGILTGSLGILSEALHSTLDLIAAVITFFSVSISDKPADKEHNYGHGKVENFSALIETLLLLITCVWIIYEAVNRLVTGETEIKVNIWSYIVVITAIIIDVTRSRALSKVAKKHNSQALEADALHFSTDVWSSSVVLLGLICANFGFFFADSIAALFVAILVVSVSLKLGKKSIDVLLDTAPQDKVHMVEVLLSATPEVISYHDLKIRSAGANTFIKVNVHLQPDLSLKQVHEICDKIEIEIGNLIKRSEVYIHAEPEENVLVNVQ